jgi:uncharacterized protein YjiK
MARRGDDASAAGLKLLEHGTLGVKSASAIAPLGGGAALVVDDDEGIFLADADGGATLLRGRGDAKGLGDLEGLCLSDDGATAYAVSEKKGQVFALAVRRDGSEVTLGDPELLGRVERPGDTKNRGWEGAGYLPAAEGDGPRLVLVHEDEPMAVGIFALPSLTPLALLPLEGVFAEWMGDASDVTVCPVTGHLFLLSDRSQCIVQAAIGPGDRLEPLGVFGLDLSEGEKPEGIAFESPTRLVVVTDDASRLLRYAVTR